MTDFCHFLSTKLLLGRGRITINGDENVKRSDKTVFFLTLCSYYVPITVNLFSRAKIFGFVESSYYALYLIPPAIVAFFSILNATARALKRRRKSNGVD